MGKKKTEKSLENQITKTSSKRTYISQAKISKLALTEAICLAQALYDDFAGQPTAPHQLAMALDISPTSSKWQDLCGASMAYDLTSGGYNAKSISLTDLGRRVVAPIVEGDDLKAKVKAALHPEIPNGFYKQYNRAKFPQDKIARNVISGMGVPPDRVESVLKILKSNGEYVGIIHQTKTGPFVAIDTTSVPDEGLKTMTEEAEYDISTETEEKLSSQPIIITPPKNQRVFITHGKNKEIVNQLKDLLTFGKFTPVVAQEHETTSKPVPDKVLEDMRSCFAGIIHIASEDELLDKEGSMHHKINENVLIEIGASMALYGQNFILLVQKGIHLPSNLQGLYHCEYEGDKLDYEATMKLLKAFNEFK